MKTPFWIILLILAFAFSVITISEIKQEKKNAPVGQTIENAGITLTAPPLVRREAL